MRLIPAILTNDDVAMQEMLGLVEKGGFERAQIDFVDEEFSNQTLPVAKVDVNKFLKIKFDAHLMVAPEVVWDEIEQCKISGFSRIIVQVESLPDWSKFLAESEGLEKGVAVDLETSVEQIDEALLPKFDVVLLMGVEAGFGGQMFDNRVIEKIKELKEIRKARGLGFGICVDGGVERSHLGILEDLGVDEVAVGVKRLVEWKKEF